MKELVRYSLDTFFENHLISKSRDENNFYEGDLVIEIRRNELFVTWIGSSISRELYSHRIIPTLQLIQHSLRSISENINCKIILGPHDTLTKRDPDSRNITKIGFCCPLDSAHIPIPDPHYLNFIQRPFIDQIQFDEKIPKAIFRGSDTGGEKRLKFCMNSLSNDFLDCKISRFLSNDAESLAKIGIDIKTIKGDWMEVSEQLQYKYIIDMEGNAGNWDRACWGLPSNSIVLLIPPDTKRFFTWYYPYIMENDIIPEFSQSEVLKLNSSHIKDSLLEVQQSFARKLLNPETVLHFFREFLLKYNHHYNS